MIGSHVPIRPGATNPETVLLETPMALTWNQMDPDPRFLSALDTAGEMPMVGSTSDKRNWGTRFADACAVMFANELRSNPTFRSLEIRPNADGSGKEALTGVGGRGKKKVDVIASSLASGLQVALSLKAENFSHEDAYGKNLTNRLYELQDEVRAIHEYQPRAYVVGVFFLPLGTVADRRVRSSFARAVASLRARTGRIDFSLPTQLNRLDWSVVGIYVPHAEPQGPARGVVRYFDIFTKPPRVGRPKIDSTMTIEGVVSKIAHEFQKDAGEIMEWAEPE